METGAEGSVKIGENEISFADDGLVIEGQHIPLESGKKHELKAFIDKSVMEVFIDEKETFTAMLCPVIGNYEIKGLGNGFKINAYELEADGLFTKG